MSAPSLAGFLDEVKIKETRLSHLSLRADLGRLDELMASIDKVGLLQPIVVRPVDDGYEVIAGNRRFEACRRLGWIKVPCHVVELDDKESFEISLIENVQRNMLNPIEEAKAFKSYVIDHGWGSVSHLAHQIGKTQVYVSKRMSLLKLPEQIQLEISYNQISPSVGEALIMLNNENKQIEISKLVVDEHLTRSEVRNLVRNMRDEDINNYGLFMDSIPYSHSALEKQQQTTDRALTKSIAALKVALHRIDDSIHLLEDGWVVRELLFEHRKAIHSHIDALLNLRKRLSRHPLPS